MRIYMGAGLMLISTAPLCPGAGFYLFTAPNKGV